MITKLPSKTQSAAGCVIAPCAHPLPAVPGGWQSFGVGIGMLLAVAVAATAGTRDAFVRPDNGENLGIWRITNDPSARHWANYHNTRCWSFDGRYLCYTTKAHDRPVAEVFIYDAHTDTSRRIGHGDSPRWAHQRNWLFYRGLPPDGKRVSEIIWLDLETEKVRTVAHEPGEIELGEPDANDQWLFGGRLARGPAGKVRSAIRIRIGDPVEVQNLPGVRGYQFLPNPRHPLFFTRWRQDPGDFSSSRSWYDLDGGNERIGIPLLQNAHTSWLGNGEYHLMGNGLVRGRRWDEPFPSNVHILAAVTVGDISPCGASGRFATGDHTIADLRSGDGWQFIDPLSIICFPASVGDESTIYDADPKGSPDGTKVTFVSNYDLKHGPVSFLTAAVPATGDALPVKSTRDFPAQGMLVIRSEVIGYARKTPTAFEGLSRRQHDTALAPLREGVAVTLFASRLLAEDDWRRMGTASVEMRRVIKDPASVLLRQRQTDVYVAVVRRPDRPWLRPGGNGLQLIPGEEHRETFGYHILHHNRRITREPLRPGSRLELPEPGEYCAIAVERSGLESEGSLAVTLARGSALEVLGAAPADFSWTSNRWLVNEAPATEANARRAGSSVREIVHLYDGVIHREWYERGTIVRRHDLGRGGKPIRRLSYTSGNVALREYYNSVGQLVSREQFGADGFIRDTILFDPRADGAPVERDHWWFAGGMPVRQVKQGREFGRVGDKWTAVSK